MTVLERYAADVGCADETAEVRDLTEADRFVRGEV